MTPNKDELLKHYARREPKEFWQFDGWLNAAGDEFLFPNPETGLGLTVQITWELMSGIPEIRVLMPKTTTDQQAVALLREVIASLEGKRPQNGGD